MNVSPLLMALRAVKRRKIIHDAFGPRGNRGPLAATLAFETDADPDPGTAIFGDEKFKTDVLDGLKAQDKRIEGMEAKQAEVLKAMPANLKLMLEDLTKLKKHANDTQANFDATTKKLASVQAMLQSEARRGWQTPIERIERDEELRARLNIVIRLALSRTAELLSQKMVGQAKELTGLEINELKAREEQRHNQLIIGRTPLAGDSSPGSNLVDDRLAREIYDTLEMFGIWNTFQVVPVGTATTKFPVTTARATANFITSEGAAITEGAFTGDTLNCVVEAIAALIPVSLQLLEDSEFDITSFVMEHFGEAYANRLDHACLNAAGAVNGTDGGMTGVFQGGTAAVADAGGPTVDGGTMTGIKFKDVLRCLTTVSPAVLNRPAKWWLHPHTIIRMLNIVDLNGRPIFLTALEAPAPGSIGSILGRPVVPCFAAPSGNVASSKVAVFGDPRGLVVGMRRAYSFAASDDYKWNTLERTFRGWGRAGVKIRKSTTGPVIPFSVLTTSAT